MKEFIENPDQPLVFEKKITSKTIESNKKKKIINVLQKAGFSLQDVFSAFHKGKMEKEAYHKAMKNIKQQLKDGDDLGETVVLTDEEEKEIVEAFEKDENLILTTPKEKSKWYYFEPWESANGWRFRLMHRNGNIILDSEAYSSKYAMENTLERLAEEFNVEIRTEKD